MAALPMAFSSVNAAPRVYAATAAKSSSGSDEKSLLDWILGGLQKEDQLLETDPILKKVEEKGSRSKSVTVPPKNGKKNGGSGLGGLFAKK